MQFRRRDSKAQLFELVIADMLRVKAAASGARSSGDTSVEPACSSGAMHIG